MRILDMRMLKEKFRENLSKENFTVLGKQKNPIPFIQDLINLYDLNNEKLKDILNGILTGFEITFTEGNKTNIFDLTDIPLEICETINQKASQKTKEMKEKQEKSKEEKKQQILSNLKELDF